MVVQADFVFASLYSLLGDGLTTGAWMVELLDKIKNDVHGTNVRVGTVIRAPFLVDGSGTEDTWEELVGDADGRISLTVFQQDIIAGIVFFDQ
jgi:hypothetical protein